MTQPPTGAPDPYQFDPYQQGAPTPPDAYAPPPAGDAPEQPSAWGVPAGQPEQPAYGAPAYPAQPYSAPDAQQAYASQPYGASDPYGAQQPYGAPDPAQQPHAAPGQAGYGAQPYGAPDPAQQAPYGAPYGGYPAYGPPAPSSTNALAITGFVLAIVGLLFCWVPGLNVFAAILGLAGVVLGIVGLVQVKSGKTGKGFALSAIIVGALTILGTILTYVALFAWADTVTTEYEQSLSESVEELDRMSGDASDEILANDVTVDFGAFEATEDDYGWVESALPVTVTNTADEAKTYSIVVTALDADGAVLSTDYVFTSQLEPGASESVDVFQYQAAEDLDALRSATFEVESVSQF